MDWRILMGYLMGIYLFGRGFLLSRTVLSAHNNVTCTYSPPPSIPREFIGNKPFDRLLFIVIDALRFDFVQSQKDINQKDIKIYHNLFTEISSIDPNHWQLFNLLADPPTTTMQRLKGISTGSLPTFIDAGANFDASKISEDSLIYQLNASSCRFKNTYFMGDETWIQLFPDFLGTNKSRSFPYESFKLFDLHTVDNGIKKHLFPILYDNNYDVIIAHFLGVDHCGHKFGPNHQSMREKLLEMDKVLFRISQSLTDDDTLMVVIGDHGMTEEGDHGGDSASETSSAFWTYSRRKDFILSKGRIEEESKYWKEFLERIRDKRQSILGRVGKSNKGQPQIDLLPTLSVLLGIPIPFGNLGSLIPDLMVASNYAAMEASSLLSPGQIGPLARIINLDYMAQMFQCNMLQIAAYLKRYTSTSAESNFDEKSFKETFDQMGKIQVRLENARNRIESVLISGKDLGQMDDVLVKEFEQIIMSICEIQSKVLKYCSSVWSNFDINALIYGCFVLIFMTIMHAMEILVPIKDENNQEKDKISLFKSLLLGSIVGLLQRFLIGKAVFEKFGWFDFVIVGCSGVNILYVGGSRFRRGFNILESFNFSLASGTSFLLFLTHSIGFASNSFIIFEDSINRFLALSALLAHFYVNCFVGKSDFITLAKYGGLALLVRMSGFVGACREEQYPYCKVFSHLNFSLLPLKVSIGAIWFCYLIFGSIMWLRIGMRGRGRGGDLGKKRERYLLGIVLFLVFVQWTLLAKQSWLRADQFDVDIDDGIEASKGPNQISNGTLKWNPSTIDNNNVLEMEFMLWNPRIIIFLVIAKLKSLCSNNDDHGTNQDDYKLYYFFMLVAIVQRPLYGLVTVGFLVSIELFRSLPRKNGWLEMILLMHLSYAFFFATGHHSVFAAIQWEAGFVGVREVYPLLVFLLVSLNTLGGTFLCCLVVSSNKSTKIQSLYLLMHAIPCVLAAIFNVILKRHLMVWKIFTPRWMLQSLILAYLLIMLKMMMMMKK